VQPDPVTIATLKQLLPTTDDTLLRAGVWNNVRSAFHNAAIDPADVLDLLEVGMPIEDSDDAVYYTLAWAINKVAPLTGNHATALARIHTVTRSMVEAAEPGSTLQLAAFQAAASSAADADLLRGWLEGRDLPPGLEIDLDLRWRTLVRLAALGAVDRTELDAALADEATARSRVEHAKAMAALPDEEAKAWAWRRFSGEVDVPNYELEASGLGMWQVGQELLTEPYVDRYFDELPDTVEVRQGWVLADAAHAYFPMTSLTDKTLARARELIDADGLDPSLRRAIIDRLDDLVRRIAVRQAFPGP
jgi:aminopeptidase N